MTPSVCDMKAQCDILEVKTTIVHDGLFIAVDSFPKMCGMMTTAQNSISYTVGVMKLHKSYNSTIKCGKFVIAPSKVKKAIDCKYYLTTIGYRIWPIYRHFIGK